jgi:hypothetical protein
MSERITLYDATDESTEKHPGAVRRMAVEAALELIRAYGANSGLNLGHHIGHLSAYADHIQKALEVVPEKRR